jgi:pimeloyl-ACP methyl ester carboxylesterase
MRLTNHKIFTAPIINLFIMQPKHPILFFLIFSLLVLYTNAQQNSNMQKTKMPGYAMVNGLKMYYEIAGNGSIPLVLIHGGGSTIETNFGNILPFFAGYGKLIAVELQAHGRSGDRNAPESYEQDADDVVALLRHLKIGKANILGFSDGACTALQIIIIHPEVVNKAVLVSANYKREGMAPGFFEGLQKATLASMPPLLQEGYNKVAPDKTHLIMMFEKDVARRLAFKDLADDDLRSIKTPTLVMAGDHDVIKTEHSVQMAQLIPGAKLVILPGAHGTLLGEICAVQKGSSLPKITAILVKEFLQE